MKRALLVLALVGCAGTHFPSYILDQAYPNGHPLVINASDPRTEDVETAVVELCNAARAVPFRRLQPLDAIARGYSRHMFQHGFYGHVDPEGNDAAGRMAALAEGWGLVAENVWVVNSDDTAQFIFDGFMASPDHRDNILDPRLDSVGVGIALSDDGSRMFVTMEFILRQ